MKNLYFRISTRPCFIHICKTLTSNPELLNFPPPCQRFLPIQRTLFLSLFLSFIKQWWRSWGEWGGQMWKGTNLSLARTHTNISPPNPYASWPITLLRKIHSRCWRSPPAKKKYTAPPHNTKPYDFAGNWFGRFCGPDVWEQSSNSSINSDTIKRWLVNLSCVCTPNLN